MREGSYDCVSASVSVVDDHRLQLVTLQAALKPYSLSTWLFCFSGKVQVKSSDIQVGDLIIVEKVKMLLYHFQPFYLFNVNQN